ncbi:biotin/lipoyl-binding protein [Ruegeria atlantica]|uniref:Type I secretion membrane fusion protein, HlyD family n=1 Tax=Ruegeria atlantica TaxID=81569 RepID=A0A0N7LQB0_9RHOB|nr:biotin/lipoyl-binding protein [Ruegeria atlantica]CUH47516.1 type I secretion membrane fusion protein, HlyD family [Ruegeria atlantica]
MIGATKTRAKHLSTVQRTTSGGIYVYCRIEVFNPDTLRRHGKSQLIEATEPGVLQSLHVAEGLVVNKGTLLMEFDTTQIESQLSQEQQRAFGLMARAQRLQAEIDGTQLTFSGKLI